MMHVEKDRKVCRRSNTIRRSWNTKLHADKTLESPGHSRAPKVHRLDFQL